MAIQDGTLNGGSAQSDGQPTGNAYLDSLIWGCKWDFSFEQTITYAFDTRFPAFLPSEMDAFRQIVSNFEAVCKVDFVERPDTQHSDILWILDFSLPGGALGFHEVPDGNAIEPLWGAFSIGHAGWDNMPIQGSFSYNTVLHEIGHGMGLAHPHDGGTQSDATKFAGVSSDDDTGDNGLNQGIWTVMSYNDGWDQAPGVNPFDAGPSYGWAGTLMAFDIAALQYLYGVNTSHKTGDDSYTLVSSNGNGTFWSCIWDAGGTDTISNVGSSTGSTINLNDAPLTGANAGGFVSRVDGILGGFTIANGAVIENAIGGSAKDVITGNEFANKLEGRNGNDELYGEDGNDTLEGGAGADVLNGGAGIDMASYSDGTVAITFNLAGDGQFDLGRGLDTFTSIEGIVGTQFADKLSGSNSVRLYGGGGDDLIEGSSAADYLFGGSGTGDTLSYANAAGSVSVTLSQGNTNATETGGGTDLLAEFENFIGSMFADTIIAGSDKNKLEGGEGDDYIFGGTAADYMDGGDGIDTLSYSNSFAGSDSKSVTVNLLLSTASGTGHANGDTIFNFENVIAGTGNDNLTGNAGGNTFQGNGGNDILFGGGGLDIYIFGFNGDIDTIEDFSLVDGDQISFNTFSFVQSLADMFARELISESGGDTTIDFGFGDAIILKNIAAGDLTDNDFLFVAANEIVGTSGADTINGTVTVAGQPFASEGEDVIQGLEGNDDINALGGNDFVDGGVGDDKMVGGTGNDTVSYEFALGAVTVTLASSSQQDTIGAGKDTISQFENITGSAFDDKLTGDAQNNILIGGDGNDLLAGGSGVDAFGGGDGNDTVTYAGSNAAVTVVLDGKTVANGNNLAAEEEFYSVENVVGTSFADSLTGNAAANLLEGGADADTLNGGDGADTLVGGAGGDTLTGGADADTFEISGAEGLGDTYSGGSGDDTLRIKGSATTTLSKLDASASSVERLEGNGEGIAGTSGADAIDLSYLTFVANVDFLDGLAGSDTLIGSYLADKIFGGDGADTLDGGDGADTLIGGAGGDTLTGGADADTFKISDAEGLGDTYSGGSGDDTLRIEGTAAAALSKFDASASSIERLEGNGEGIVGTSGADAIDLSYLSFIADIDFLDGLAGNDTLIGSYLADKILGGSGDDTLDGGGDDDTLTGGVGNDVLTGGSGLDIYIFGFDSDSDTINDFGIADGDIITLTSFSFLQSVQDLFARGMISESGGDTTIDFGGGDSILLAGVDANSLTDNHFEFAMATNIVGTAGNDIINGTQTVAGQPFATDGEEDIRGLEGDDNINALGGNDIVEGGAGNDKMVGGNGSDTVTYENALNAVFVTLASTSLQDTKGAGKDTLSQFENLAGSAFDDKLTGDKNDNILDGDDGDDLLIGGLGSDTLTGGANGVLGDTASYAGITASVSASLAGGQASYANGKLTDTDTFFGIENLIGGSGADQLFGDANANTLDGAGGNDQIFGDAGNDTLIGGLGNDVLQGDDGDDLLIGGAGADAMDGKNDGDTASYAASTAGVTVVLDGITLGKGGDATGDKLSNIEHLIGSAKNDKLTGNGADNKLEGGAGDDTLDGGAGLDDFFGGDGNDTLIGGAGADDYDGGAGNNTVSYAASTAAVNIALDDMPGVGKGYANDSLNDKFVNIQNLIGTDLNDTLRGDDNVNILMGGGGNDFLLANASYAGAKGDTLSGGEGDDYILGFAGDKLDGGLGDDTLQAQFAGSGSTVTVNLATNQFSVGALKSAIKGFENVRGDLANNVLTGTAGANRLIGEDGNDTIEGGAGADVLDGDVGNAGNDTVVYASSNAGVTIDLTQQGTDSDLNNAPAGAQKGGHAEGDALYNFENAVGSKFADKITGTAVDNIIEGGLGNDILDGGAHGANGDTVSFASSTAAIVYNLGTQSNVTPVNTGAGNDIIFGFENILGGKGNDKLTGNANKNTVDGGAGNDIIEGGGDEDRLFGGFGIDTISYALSAVGVAILLMEQGSIDQFGNIIDGTEQTGGDAAGDLLWGFENITGSAAGDTLEGDSLANVILGGGGSDTIFGLGGKDTLDGGLGIDTLDYRYFTAGQNLVLTLGTLNTTTGAVAKTSTSGIVGDIDGVMNFENVTGGDGNDKITGNAGINILEGRVGNDTLSGMAGNDTLNGDGGNDVLEGGLGDDAIDGGADNDTASYATATAGVTVDLQIDGLQQNTIGAGNDGLVSIENLIGSAKSDNLTGDEFDNVIEGGLGDDLLDGRTDAGIGDKLSYAAATAAVTFDLGLQGTQQNTGGGGKDTATGFEDLAGGKGNDKLTGDGGNNDIFGGAGNDVLDGGSSGGYDRLVGGAGADKMTAGYLGFSVQFEISGTDAIGDVYTGGSSDDSLVITGISSATLSKFDAAVSSIERLNGNTHGIVGTAGADAIDLSHLNFIDSVPFIDGLGGNDKITGSFAADTLLGGAGVDTLDGKAGADHLHGGVGLDVLTGGLGADTFHIKWAEGADKITDFVSGVDEIELDLLPTQNPTQLLSAPGVTAHNGPDAALIYNETDGKLYYDPGATGANVLIATLTDKATIDFGDFTFI